MRTTFKTGWKWFLHGIKILVGGLAAYLISAVPFGLLNMAFKLSPGGPVSALIIAAVAAILIPACIALFGYLFTRLYTGTTWGHDAVRDLELEGNNDVFTTPTEAEDSSEN